MARAFTPRAASACLVRTYPSEVASSINRTQRQEDSRKLPQDPLDTRGLDPQPGQGSSEERQHQDGREGFPCTL